MSEGKSKRRGGVAIKPLKVLDWFEDVEQDVFGVPYEGLDKEAHEETRKLLTKLDKRHFGPYFRVLDVLPILALMLARLEELAKEETDPEAKKQVQVLFEQALEFSIKTTGQFIDSVQPSKKIVLSVQSKPPQKIGVFKHGEN